MALELMNYKRRKKKEREYPKKAGAWREAIIVKRSNAPTGACSAGPSIRH